MHPLRRGLLILLSPLLPLLLFMTALDWGVVKTVGQPAEVKKIVSDSGIYSTLVPNLLSQTKQINTSVGQIPLTDPTVKQAANQAFTPKEVQANIEAAIDNIYQWLDGKTAQPNFNINFTGSQTDFANNLAGAVQQKAASLPTCKTFYTSGSFDVYSATCLPYGVTPEAVAANVKSQIQQDSGFLDKPLISAGDIKDSQGQSLFNSRLASAPTQYQRAKKSPNVLVALVILTAAGIILLSPDRRKGFRHVGATLILIGIFMMLFAWAINRANSNIIQPKVFIANPVMQADVRKLAGDIVQAVNKNYWMFGIIYAVAGCLTLGVPIAINRKGSPPAKAAGAAATVENNG